MLVATLQSSTSSRLAVVDVTATVKTAALALSTPGIGLVVVCNGVGGAEGVVSKSDLVRHLAGPARPAPQLSDLMTRSIVACSPQDDVHATWETMTAHGLQNMPVLDALARPIGILDIRDAMKALFEQEEMQERMLSNYVSGIGYR
jgi:CBS domain-containing protein